MAFSTFVPCKRNGVFTAPEDADATGFSGSLASTHRRTDVPSVQPDGRLENRRSVARLVDGHLVEDSVPVGVEAAEAKATPETASDQFWRPNLPLLLLPLPLPLPLPLLLVLPVPLSWQSVIKTETLKQFPTDRVQPVVMAQDMLPTSCSLMPSVKMNPHTEDSVFIERGQQQEPIAIICKSIDYSKDKT
ncbi:unnamed protein product [Soboliphyme baturini]|uniref:Uncharacterized protein n=1 Tax=Soboliphyme baturini TaxID=241478 RepID=A0A183ICW3_9BILA|nr:unnamed protein product [Soboliphyme baturini]